MAIKLSGMSSGLDTDSIVAELVKAKSVKKTNLEKDQKKLSWTQDAWKGLNTKIYSFYSKTLSNMRTKSDYIKKTTKASSDAVSVVTGSNAANCVQSLKVTSMARSGYLTGAKLDAGFKVTSSTRLGDLMEIGADETKTITIKNGSNEPLSIDVTADTTVNDVVKKIRESGVTVNFDEKNQRAYISASGLGVENDFELGGDQDVLRALGIGSGQGVRVDATDAAIELNGVEYTGSSNAFDINGLTISINHETDEEIVLTTTNDTDGIYKMVKDFIKEYNGLIKEMDKLYNAESAYKYKMLSDDEKEAMEEDEIKEWEDKIKSALLKSDSTLGNIMESMKKVMYSGVQMSDGSRKYLDAFGIGTLGYFSSAENEKSTYHIDGDEDDTATSAKTDMLKAAIASDPDGVAEFFATLTRNMYDTVDNLMKRTDNSSAFTVYNDKLMKSEYDEYTRKIANQQTKVDTWEDFYYKKFTRMETALTQLEGKQNAISGLFNN